jgi:hypothetical protein
MTQEFVPYQQALALKKLGFNEPCFGIFNKEGKLRQSEKNNHNLSVDRYDFPIYDEKSIHYEGIRAPTYSQALTWFRKKSGIEGFVHKSIEGNYYFVIKRTGNNESNMYEFTKTAPKIFKTYEEAEIACLIKLIEIVKNK